MDTSTLPLTLLACLLFGQFQTAVRGNKTSDCGDISKRVLLQDNYYEIVQRLDTLTKEVETLKTQTVNRPATPVVFLAKLNQEVSGSGHHIYFGQVDLNLGNAYNPHHGTFVAPANGTYLLSLKACSDTNHFIVLDIMANNKLVERMIAGDMEYYACSSTIVNVHLTAGDDVFIKQGQDGDCLASLGKFGVPVFTGVLLQTD